MPPSATLTAAVQKLMEKVTLAQLQKAQLRKTDGRQNGTLVWQPKMSKTGRNNKKVAMKKQSYWWRHSLQLKPIRALCPLE